MTPHKLGVKTKQAGGGGTVHVRSVDDCIDLIHNAETVPDETLTLLTELSSTDFEDGLTIAAVNRCIDDQEVIVQEVTADDVKFTREDEPTVPMSLESITTYYNLCTHSDSPDVVRAIIEE